jgi:hypothetical protein
MKSHIHTAENSNSIRDPWSLRHGKNRDLLPATVAKKDTHLDTWQGRGQKLGTIHHQNSWYSSTRHTAKPRQELECSTQLKTIIKKDSDLEANRSMWRTNGDLWADASHQTSHRIRQRFMACAKPGWKRNGEYDIYCGEWQPSSYPTNRKPEKPDRSNHRAKNISQTPRPRDEAGTERETTVGTAPHSSNRRRDSRPVGQTRNGRDLEEIKGLTLTTAMKRVKWEIVWCCGLLADLYPTGCIPADLFFFRYLWISSLQVDRVRRWEKL